MADPLIPTLLPLGDQALLVRFSTELSETANRAAISLARQLERETVEGIEEIAPGLVSGLLRYNSSTDFWRLRGEIMLRMRDDTVQPLGRDHTVGVAFDGKDVEEVATLLAMTREAFIARHNSSQLRVLATGFAPGFVYCGFHSADLSVPRREAVRAMVPAGTVLFAAGQTAIAATPIRSGWHVIGTTRFRNFDPASDPPTRLRAGDTIRFEADR